MSSEQNKIKNLSTVWMLNSFSCTVFYYAAATCRDLSNVWSSTRWYFFSFFISFTRSALPFTSWSVCSAATLRLSVFYIQMRIVGNGPLMQWERRQRAKGPFAVVSWWASLWREKMKDRARNREKKREIFLPADEVKSLTLIVASLIIAQRCG